MINIIAAMTHSGIIGKGNQLPWDIPDELRHFRTTTSECTVIMGRRTFESIGRPLPKRTNIVLAPPAFTTPGVDVCSSIDEALNVARSHNKRIFVIGGASVYAQFLPLTTHLYMSYIKRDYDGDVFFPAFDKADWNVIEEKDYSTFTFVLYKRKIAL